MKKLINRFLGVVVVAALLMGTVMPNVAVMAETHQHHKDDKVLDEPSVGYTITLKKPATGYNAPTTAKFGAYQIFTGTVKGSAVDENPGTNTPSIAIPLTDIKWGNAFGDLDSETWQNNIVEFVLALANPPKTGDTVSAFNKFTEFEEFDNDSNPKELADKFYKDSSHTNANVNFDKLATEVADVISAHNDHEWLQAFNDILGGYGKDYSDDGHGGYVIQCYDKYNGQPGQWAGDEYKIKVPAGYYMVLDRSDVDASNEAFSARMLFVAENIIQTIKEDIPTLDKNIRRDDGKYKTEVAGVGDTVEFQLTGTLPSNYDYYTLGYQYKFEDTFSKGLTLQLKDADTPKVYVTVTVEGVLNGGVWDNKTYTIKKESINSTGVHTHGDVEEAYTENYDTEANKLTVEFPCLKEILIKEGSNEYTLGCNPGDTSQRSKIYVTYTAMINENAIVNPSTGATAMNGNKNTATLEYSDNPQNYEDTETTITSEAEVYTFGLDIVKIDAAEFLKTGDKSTAALEGAKFAMVRKAAGNTWEIATWKTVKKDEITGMAPMPNLPSSFKDNGYYAIILWEPIVNDKNENVTSTAFDPAWLEIAKYKDNDLYNIATLTEPTKGTLNVSGLDADVEYTMVETQAPGRAGEYAKIAPFTIELTAEKGARGEYTGKLSDATSNKDVMDGKSFSFEQYVDIIDPIKDDSIHADDDGSANMLVANFKYVDLPSTGGIGIYPFYIIGGIVVAGSIILFALSRRKKTA